MKQKYDRTIIGCFNLKSKLKHMINLVEYILKVGDHCDYVNAKELVAKVKTKFPKTSVRAIKTHIRMAMEYGLIVARSSRTQQTILCNNIRFIDNLELSSNEAVLKDTLANHDLHVFAFQPSLYDASFSYSTIFEPNLEFNTLPKRFDMDYLIGLFTSGEQDNFLEAVEVYLFFKQRFSYYKRVILWWNEADINSQLLLYMMSNLVKDNFYHAQLPEKHLSTESIYMDIFNSSKWNHISEIELQQLKTRWGTLVQEDSGLHQYNSYGDIVNLPSTFFEEEIKELCYDCYRPLGYFLKCLMPKYTKTNPNTIWHIILRMVDEGKLIATTNKIQLFDIISTETTYYTSNQNLKFKGLNSHQNDMKYINMLYPVLTQITNEYLQKMSVQVKNKE